MVQLLIGTGVDNFLFYDCTDKVFFSMKCNKIDKKLFFFAQKRFCNIPY